MFCQSQAFPTEKKTYFVWLFVKIKTLKKAKCVEKSQILKSGFKKSKLATLCFADMACERSCSVTTSDSRVLAQYRSFVTIFDGADATLPTYNTLDMGTPC